MLEDAFEDIIAKARFGLGWSLNKLAKQVQLSETRIAALERGVSPEKSELIQLAAALGLCAEKLEMIARKTWEPIISAPYLQQNNLNRDMIHIIEGELWHAPVYAYLLIDWQKKEAVLFDTADRPKQVTDFIEKEKIRVLAICLTHADDDHVGGLAQIHQKTGAAPVYLHANERSACLKETGKSEFKNPLMVEKEIRLGSFRIKALETPGHTAGGISYLIESESEGLGPIAFVGDALFAGSLGRAKSSYPELLESVRKNILSLPQETLLFPGHGSPTSVGEERAHNPFFVSQP